jgi:hypothetical protein
MNLKEILHSVSSTLNQVDPNLMFGIDRFNLFLKLANYDYFKLWCGLPEQWQPGQPVTSRGWQVAAQNTEALKTFIVPFQNYTVDAGGHLSYPSGFVHLSRIGYFNSVTSRQRPVEILTHEEADDRISNYIVVPEKEYPVAIYENTYIQFYPIDLLNVSMSYLRLPVTPIYAIKQENGIDVYDDVNSIELEWPEQYHADIVRMLIGYLSPPSKDMNLSNYIETKKAQGV